MSRKKRVNSKPVFEWADEAKEKLSFPRGVLVLLKDTRLFGPQVEQAIEDIDYLIEKAGELGPCENLPNPKS